MDTLQRNIDKKEKQINALKRQNKYLREEEKEKQRDPNDPTPKTPQRRRPPLDTESAKTHPIPDILANAGITLVRNKFALRDEKTPSCNYYENNNNYYDFGSASGGDSIDLYMKIYSCDFVEAVRNLM